jgi:transposase
VTFRELVGALGIREADWRRTPEVVREVLETLVHRIERLEEKLNENSGNSSKPPSSDRPDSKPAKPKRKSTGRKPGGQPGHAPHERKLLPEEAMAQVTDVKPETCEACGGELLGEDAHPIRHQVTEVPVVEPEHREWRLHRLTCGCCGHRTRARLPEGVPQGAFGPRVMALVALITGAYRLTRRTAQQAMKDLFGVDISLGSVSISEQTVSDAIEAPVADAQDYVQQQPVAFVDETGWKQRAKSAFVWVASTAKVAVYQIASRSREAAQQLLGAFAGVLTSDRYIVYAAWDSRRRQVCWAHLARAFQKMSERSGRAGDIGEQLVDHTVQLFYHWHRIRDGTIQWATFQRNMFFVRWHVERLLRDGACCGHDATEGTCKKILESKEALWTFSRIRGLQPTNNEAERALRKVVQWRKLSFGSWSERGSIFAARMLTVSVTCRKQGRNVLDYLVAAMIAHQHRRQAPSLLPA